MAEQLAGTATIRLKLDISPQDRALLNGFGGAGGRSLGMSGGGGGGLLAGGVGAARGGMIPGGRAGPSILSGLASMAGSGGLASAISVVAGLAPVAALFGPTLLSWGKGLGGRFMNAGNDIAEGLGAAGYARETKIAPMAADRTVSQLGIAAKYMSEAKIKAIYGINEQMATAEIEAENRVRQVIGAERVASFIEKILQKLDIIASNTNQKPAPAATSTAPRVK